MRGGVALEGVECVTVALFGPLGRGRQADPLWGVQQKVLSCLDSVLHEHGHGHGTHTSGHRGDEARLLSHA